MSGSCSKSARSPSRTTGWSSATSTLITRLLEAGASRRPGLPEPWTGLTGSTDLGSSRLDRLKADSWRPGVHAVSVVGNGDREERRVSRQRDHGLSAGRVTHDVVRASLAIRKAATSISRVARAGCPVSRRSTCPARARTHAGRVLRRGRPGPVQEDAGRTRVRRTSPIASRSCAASWVANASAVSGLVRAASAAPSALNAAPVRTGPRLS